MDEQRAKLLLEKTFKSSFDGDNFVLFIKELFNKFDYSKIDAEQEEIPKEFQEFIESYSLFGRYEDPEKKFLEVLAVKLKKSNPESARSMQRNFVAKYLEHRNANTALVAFYGDEIDNWRFSFVKLEYHLEKDEKGNVKPTTSLTPPKRYSFLVGKTEPSHTAQSKFLELLMKEDSGLTVSEIESSFSVEKVTKEFFEKYKELFLELEESLNKIVRQNRDLAKEFDEKGISTIDFTKKLLGQIVFIYFLQKKGWLGIEKDEAGKFKEWGTGHNDFLRRLYNKDIVDYDNFFNDILEPLFYEALAKDRTTENDYYSRFNCKIPFLNGGLFEPLGGYDWTNVDILLDDKIFGKIIGIFDLYNFTVKEDEPLEKEVAIDPEMLGKVFENLLEVKDRKSKGSYYTPREIVYYMCQESLINYLETRTGIEKKNIDDFIYNWQISSQIRDNRDRVDKLLKDIKVVDPAIGSGAFLVGMMMEIIKARGVLTKLFPKEEQSERTTYNFKRECIEDNLYGVDIDPGAVDIAQLRLWLSLIVDEEDIHKIKPLPNLDYKIMCGNSLLDEFEEVKLFDERLLGEIKKEDYSEEINSIEENIGKLYEELGMITTGKKKDYGMSNGIKREIDKLKKKKQKLMATPQKEGVYGSLFEAQRIKESQKKLKQLQALHKQFFNEHNRRNKIELRAEIEKRDWEFIEETLKEQGNEEARKKFEQIKKARSKPFFLWKLYFSDVFQENGGFDIVIANPPYVSSWNMGNDYKDYYLNHFKSAVGHYDLYVLFFEKALNIIRNRGVLFFITSNKYMSQGYGKGIREIFLQNEILSLINFKFNVFEATVDTCITAIKKDPPTNNLIKILEVNSKIATEKDIEYILKDNSRFKLFKQEKFGIKKNFRTDLSEDDLNLFDKINNKSIHLGDICYVDTGVVVHSSKKNLKKEYFIKDRPDKGLKKFLEGKNIFRWHIRSCSYLDYQETLHHRPKMRELFEKEKIIMRRVIGKDGFYATYESGEYYVENGVILFTTINNLKELDYQQLNRYLTKEAIALSKRFNLIFILSIINSKVIKWFFEKFYFDGLHIYPEHIRLFPIKEVDRIQQNQFIQLVDKILDISKDSDYLNNLSKQAEVKEYEKEIDQLVYKLYHLTPGEIEIIETFCNKKIVDK